jgi:hypothetical protein
MRRIMLGLSLALAFVGGVRLVEPTPFKAISDWGKGTSDSAKTDLAKGGDAKTDLAKDGDAKTDLAKDGDAKSDLAKGNFNVKTDLGGLL